MPTVWQLLETIPGPAAVPAVWKASLGTSFDAFREHFLRQQPQPARSYPCPRECGCAHEIVKHRDGKIVAVCRCDPCQCDDIPVRESDIAILELNWSALGRAAAAALGLAAREADIGVRGTLQIAVSGSDALPVLLVIRNDRDSFRQAVDALVARLRSRFVVLAPTADFVDGTVQQVLSGTEARFVPLDTSVRISGTGTLMAAEAVDGSGIGKKHGWDGLRIGEIFEPRTMLWNGKAFLIEEPAVCYKGYDLDHVSLESYFPDLYDNWHEAIKDVPFDEVENLRILRLVGFDKTLLIQIMLRDSVPVYPERLESSGVTDGWHEGGVLSVFGEAFPIKGLHVEPTDTKAQAKIDAARRARKPMESIANLIPCAEPAVRSAYMLRQGIGAWLFTVDGLDGHIADEKGLRYVEYLFKNPPPDPIHAIQLQADVCEVKAGSGGIVEIVDPDTGERITLPRTAQIHERNLNIDNREANRRIWNIRRSWKAIIDDE